MKTCQTFLETEVSLQLQQALVTVSILFMPEGKKECNTLYCPTVKRFSPRVMPLANSVT